jgi:sugar lactone lactonase YvrE
MRRITLLTVWTALVAFVLAAPLGAGGGFPERIELPDGFRPEGIAIGKDATFYVGSIPTGAIYRGDLKTGEGSVFIPSVTGRQAIGVEYHRGILFVAGGPTGRGFIYSASSGRLLAEHQLATLPIDPMTNPAFVNDVAVARGGAYFTDSRRPFLYRVGPGGVERIPLTGDIVYDPSVNNANGIEATPDGKTLIIVQSNVGKLFTVDPRSGETDEITLDESVERGDGLLLDGRTLYVVQNTFNKVAVVRLGRRLSTGTVTMHITDPDDFDVPTTIDEFGKRLYAVNARFTTPPMADTDYWLAQFRKAK